MEPRATFDPDADVVVVELQEGTIAGTIAYPDDAHLVDVDNEGRVLSLELLNTADLRLTDIATHFNLEDVDAITAAVGAVLPARTTTTWHAMQTINGSVITNAATEPLSSTSSESSGAAQELQLVR
jgi:uncharacterized protein YuzE